MQSVSSRIWTRVAVSISYDDNHYTTGTTVNSFIEIFLVTLEYRYNSFKIMSITFPFFFYNKHYKSLKG